MKGSDLMRNLQWLGQFGRLRTLLDDDDEVKDNNDEDAEEQSDLIGGGGPQRKRRNNASYKFEEERNIRCAMPKMEGTLGNWTLHGQNLGTMLKNYNRQYRHLPPNHRRELGQIFNTTSTVLDTIGSPSPITLHATPSSITTLHRVLRHHVVCVTSCVIKITSFRV